MPYFLSRREPTRTERMDNPDCSRTELFNTYRQFSTINSMISGWKKIYTSRIRSLFPNRSQRYTLLDIGFGGGDIPIKLARWAARDGINLHITAIETDPRAMEFIQTVDAPANVTFECCSSTSLVSKNRRYDVVISNHLLHHLDASGLHQLLAEAKELSRQNVFFNDIERSDIGYTLFNFFSRPVFRRSFITEDGLNSIRRSYTANELRAATPNRWKVERLFPYRLLLTYHHAS